MIRRLINACTRAIGFSPVGSRVRICGTDGPAAEQLIGRVAEITAHVRLPHNQEMLTARVCVEASEPSSGTEFVLIPRHAYLGAEALCTTGIAVYLFPAQASEPFMLPKYEEMSAIVDIVLCKASPHHSAPSNNTIEADT